MRSDCCGYETNDTDMGICPECLEHCEFEDDEEDEDTPSDWAVGLLTDAQKAVAFNYLCGSFLIIGDTKILNKTVNQIIEESMLYALNKTTP